LFDKISKLITIQNDGILVENLHSDKEEMSSSDNSNDSVESNVQSPNKITTPQKNSRKFLADASNIPNIVIVSPNKKNETPQENSENVITDVSKRNSTSTSDKRSSKKQKK